MVFEIRVDLGLIAGIYGALFLFGVAFNAISAWMERRGYMEVVVSLMVALGVAVTLAPFALINLPFILYILGGFVFSGLPMIIGSLSRFLRRREESIRNLARLNYGNETTRLAGKR
jgi:hypothetical protein